MAGKHLEARLRSFLQWSDFSAGFPSPDALIDSCKLDARGKVSCAIKTTELIAESYAAAARIYLHCRLFRYLFEELPIRSSNTICSILCLAPRWHDARRSRKHPIVEREKITLLQCISRMQTSGPLFSGQAPLWSVFIAGIVAVSDEDRSILREWFLAVAGGTRSVRDIHLSQPQPQKFIKPLWSQTIETNFAA